MVSGAIENFLHIQFLKYRIRKQTVDGFGGCTASIQACWLVRFDDPPINPQTVCPPINLAGNVLRVGDQGDGTGINVVCRARGRSRIEWLIFPIELGPAFPCPELIKQQEEIISIPDREICTYRYTQSALVRAEYIPRMYLIGIKVGSWNTR